MDRPILELRHADNEGTGAYLAAIERVATVHTVRSWREPLPDHTDWAAVVVMGGPMGVNDADRLPWIADEIAFLRRCLAADVPVWGVCLGAQLLAAALDARVLRAEEREVGVLPVTLDPSAADDPVWGAAPTVFDTLHWHGDTVDLPSGATLLASSAACAHQLFRHGRHYAVQFHLEATAAMAGAWAEEDDAETTPFLPPDVRRRLVDDVAAIQASTRRLADEVMTRWLTRVLEEQPS